MIGIFGGSFDPVHNGHLRAALETYQRLRLEKICFLPCYQHAFSKPLQASASQRLKMLELATIKQPFFCVSDDEIKQQTTSYTIETLKAMKQRQPQEKLALMIGIDAFLELPKWQQWRTLLDYASIIVLHRPGHYLPGNGLIDEYLAEHRCKDKATFINQEIHSIFLLSIPMLEISSTYIRQQIKEQQSVLYLLPQTIVNYINEKNIY